MNIDFRPTDGYLYHGYPPSGPDFFASPGVKLDLAKQGRFPTLQADLPPHLLNIAERNYDTLHGNGLIVLGSPQEYCAKMVGVKFATLLRYLESYPRKVIVTDAVWVFKTPNQDSFSVNKPRTLEEAMQLTGLIGALSQTSTSLSALSISGCVDSEEGFESLKFTQVITDVGMLNPDMDLGGVFQVIRGNGHIAAGFGTTLALTQLTVADEARVSYRQLDKFLAKTSIGTDVVIPVDSANLPIINCMSLGFAT